MGQSFCSWFPTHSHTKGHVWRFGPSHLLHYNATGRNAAQSYTPKGLMICPKTQRVSGDDCPKFSLGYASSDVLENLHRIAFWLAAEQPGSNTDDKHFAVTKPGIRKKKHAIGSAITGPELIKIFS
jgi:hypothetical protein